MNVKLTSIIVGAVVAAAGLGYVVGNPGSIAGLSSELTGDVGGPRAYTYGWQNVAIGGEGVPNVMTFQGCASDLTRTGTTRMHGAGPVFYEPCVLTVRGALSKPIVAWIEDTIDGGAPRRQVDVSSTTEGDWNTVPGMRLHNVLLTGVAMADLDRNTDEITFRITMLPERIERGAGDASVTPHSEMSTDLSFRVSGTGIPDTAFRIQNVSFTATPLESTPLEATYTSYSPGPIVYSQPIISFADAEAKSALQHWEEDTIAGTAAPRDVTISITSFRATTALEVGLVDATLVGFETGYSGGHQSATTLHVKRVVFG